MKFISGEFCSSTSPTDSAEDTVDRRKHGLVWRAAAVAGGLAILAACSSEHRSKDTDSKLVAIACRTSAGESVQKIPHLTLSYTEPAPRISVSVGDEIEVDSSYKNKDMLFAKPTPKGGVCEISQHRNDDGSTEVVYEAIDTGATRFYSTVEQVTDAMAPGMMGRLFVSK